MSDCPRVAELAGDKRIYDMTLLIPHPYSAKQAEDWIGTHAAQWERWREDWTMNFAIRARSGGGLAGDPIGDLIGVIGLIGRPVYKRAEMGYWLGVPFWGKGFMTEAVGAVVAFAHGELGVNRIEAGVFEGNAASMNVLRKAGFVEEGLLRQRFLKDGKFVDERMFAKISGLRPGG
ncbi:MAG: GNAT family N-acetyltransferase [Phycisphaeraceae bacterium]|nr:GNAT family N-acetyltransferase [Phycisphaeraceae bacterium]